jgi:CcmD family protein
MKNINDFWHVNNRPMNRIVLTVFATFIFAFPLCAQSAGSADFMRSIGKIYVVVAVIAMVFIGIIFFLIYLDRKLTRLEDQIKDHDTSSS